MTDTIVTIPLDLIDVPEGRARDFDPAWAEALAAVVAVQGLLNPITVRATEGGRHVLVAGLHRLRAFGILGRAAIPARLSVAASDDAARLEEVMENLGRYDLIALDRCHHLHELKALWLKLYPQAKRGGDRGNQYTGGKGQSLASATDEPEIFNFGKAIAEKVGLSKQAINAAVRIWHYLTPESRRRLAGTDLARKQTELKALSEQKPAVQAKILDLILGEAPPENVAQALDYLENGVAPNALEKRFIAFSRSFAALQDEQLDSLLAAHEDRVIASLKRRGRI